MSTGWGTSWNFPHVWQCQQLLPLSLLPPAPWRGGSKGPRRHFLASWKTGRRITECSREISSRENRERQRAGHTSSPSGLGEARGKGTWGLGWEPSTFGRKRCSSRNRLKMHIISEGRPIPVCFVHSQCILCNICFKITVPPINRNILMH